MIDYINGTCTHVDIDMIVIESAGIGYQVYVGNPHQYETEQSIQIFTFQYVREDILALYGFASRTERKLFTYLMQVSGIGPKAAVTILASATPAQVIAAIRHEDIAFLTQFQGIGKKTAQRIVIDLKDKLDQLAQYFPYEQERSERQDAQGHQSNNSAHKQQQVVDEAIEVLLTLGYVDKELKLIHTQLLEQGQDDWQTEQFVKLGLQLLMK